MTTYTIDPDDWESATGEAVDDECVLVRRVPEELRERLAEAAHDSWTGWLCLQQTLADELAGCNGDGI